MTKYYKLRFFSQVHIPQRFSIYPYEMWYMQGILYIMWYIIHILCDIPCISCDIPCISCAISYNWYNVIYHSLSALYISISCATANHIHTRIILSHHQTLSVVVGTCFTLVPHWIGTWRSVPVTYYTVCMNADTATPSPRSSSTCSGVVQCRQQQ